MTKDLSSNNRPWPPLQSKINFSTYTLLSRGDLSLNGDNTIPGWTASDVDNEFIDSSNGDYRLTSSAYGSGLRTSPSNYPRDLAGQPRLAITDCGAYAGNH